MYPLIFFSESNVKFSHNSEFSKSRSKIFIHISKRKLLTNKIASNMIHESLGKKPCYYHLTAIKYNPLRSNPYV